MPADGRRWAGPIEAILYRHWTEGTPPGQQVITAIDRLATLSADLTGRLLSGLTAIHVGAGMVTDFPAMADLRGEPVDPGSPNGPTWDDIPACYRSGVIVIGSGGEPLTFDLMLHEGAHALDDIDGHISDSPDWKALHWTCSEVLVDDRYVTGRAARAEFFAESFAITYLRAWDVLVDLLGGRVDRAYTVRAWLGRTYGIGR